MLQDVLVEATDESGSKSVGREAPVG